MTVATDKQAGMSEDEIRLASLGYQQNLKRQFSAFQNFGFVLTNASVLIGIVPLLGDAMRMGGPVALTWGWLIVASFVFCIALGMAEICSTYPTAGGLYYWTAKLGGKKYGPVFSWFEAWFNSLGQIAGASGSVLAAARLLANAIAIGSGKVLDKYEIFAIFVAMIITGAIMNCVGGVGLKVTSIFSVWVHILGTIVIVIVLLVTADVKNDASFVFSRFNDASGYTEHGFPKGVVFMLGLLTSQWSMLGYDSSAHMSEETKDSYVNGPRGIVYTVIAAVTMGWALILGFMFCMDDIEAAVSSDFGAAGYVFYQTAGQKGAIFLLAIVISAGWCCGVGTMAANSRMFYAFARDNGLPASKFWTTLNTRTGMPIRLVWLSATLVIILAIPSMFSGEAMSAIAGICIIGFTVSYAIPVFLRITVGRHTFVQSEFNLGRWSTILGAVGCAWTALAFVMFQMPLALPATANTMNYTPVAVGFMLVFAGGWYALDAHKWFKGPIPDIVDMDVKNDMESSVATLIVEEDSSRPIKK
ncbi:APC amino acid permease [Gaertneriomyces semiglobifer]|nr:APC amino acid permease [Gaertneriomyces semiglobifer]KAI8995191.1 APC amino acid permease [Gaertneriomyces semiglobifer]